MYELRESIIATKNRNYVKPGCAYKSGKRKINTLDLDHEVGSLILKLEELEAYSEIATTETDWNYVIHEYTIERVNSNGVVQKILYTKSVNSYTNPQRKKTTIWASDRYE